MLRENITMSRGGAEVGVEREALAASILSA